MKKVCSLVLFLVIVLDAFPQRWEDVRDNEEYIYGEGWGASVADADEQAKADLIGKIATNVTSESHRTMKAASENGHLDESSQFTQSVTTYSQATLTNMVRKVLQNAPDAHVVVWIKRTELDKIFNDRCRKARAFVEDAVRAEKRGKVDDALKNYYWALTLLKSLQYPNDEMYTDDAGKAHILTHWIKEQMDEIFDNLKVSVIKWEGEKVDLAITYKEKPVNSVDYTYYDGRAWSGICSAKDGYGDLEMVSGYTPQQIQLKYEYEFAGQTKGDSEMEAVLNVVKGTTMKKAHCSIKTEQIKMKKKDLTQLNRATFTTTDAAFFAPPKVMGKEASDYFNLTKKVIDAIEKKDYQKVKDGFTDEGWDMFTKLINYGKARVLDSSDIRFYDYNGTVTERGLKMSFSFASNIRKSFVEDVILTFDEDKKICNLSFGLGKTAEDDILNKGVWNERSRFALMNFLENYKTAYALKRLDYIESVFDDDAVIITGTVLKRAAQSVNMENRSQLSSEGNQIIRKNRQTKDQYLKNLEACFKRNEFVNIRFANNDVSKLGVGGESYAIQIAQDYYSSTYGDKGYLMLMVDINDAEKPLIKVRTWQTEKDPNFGLYGPGDF